MTVTPEFVDALTRKIGPALKELYPREPDAVLGHEARRVARAVAPEVMGVHDPTGADHLAEMMTHARLADGLLDAVQRALAHLAEGELHEAEAVLQHAHGRAPTSEETG